MKKLSVLLLFFVLIVVGFLATTFNAARTHIGIFDAQRIAHAGGAIDGHTYTNSYEALNINYGRKFRYFELDFSLTADGRVVCIHDWKESFTELFGFSLEKPPTFTQFKHYVKSSTKYESCTLEGLANWMHTHPAAVVVTDIKSISHMEWSEIDVLIKIFEVLPDAESRVIPQIYSPESYDTVTNLGYQNIIWTLYRYDGSDDEIISWAKQFKGKIAIAMPQVKAKKMLPSRLKEIGVPTYVHTINYWRSALHFLHVKNISNIYTDHLPPNHLILNLMLKKWNQLYLRVAARLHPYLLALYR